MTRGLYYTRNAAERKRLREALIDQETKKPGGRKVCAKAVPVVGVFRSHPRDKTKVILTIWTGTAAKPHSYYEFQNSERAWKYFQTVVERQTEIEKNRKPRKAAKASDHWSVGDVAYTSWGYDQTNVEFYQIVELKPKSVVVRQVKENSSDHGQPGGGKTAPRRFEFIGPKFLCPLAPDGSFKAGPCYNRDKPRWRHHCSKWCGGSAYTSSTH